MAPQPSAQSEWVGWQHYYLPPLFSPPHTLLTHIHAHPGPWSVVSLPLSLVYMLDGWVAARHFVPLSSPPSCWQLGCWWWLVPLPHIVVPLASLWPLGHS